MSNDTRKNEQDFLNDFVHAIYHALDERRMAVRELAKKTGIKHRTVLSYLNKERKPSLYNGYLIIQALHLPCDELFGYNTDFNSETKDFIKYIEENKEPLQQAIKQLNMMLKIFNEK